MKFSLCGVLSVVIFFAAASFADEKEAPVVVKDAFAKKYVGISPTKWEFDKNGNWEAKFKKDDRKYRADFSPTGEWIETESNMQFEELPLVVQSAVNKAFPGQKIHEIEWVEIPGLGEFYDVEYKRKGKNLDIRYQADGKQVPKD